MKYLEIKDNKGFYFDGSEYKEIDKISKDDLMVLLNSAETDKFEMDTYSEKTIANKAHQIIYENIYKKLKQFLDNKKQFKKETDKLYKDAITKYSVDLKEEPYVDSYPENEEAEDTDAEDLPF